MTPQIRWMIRRDMPDVLAIESACYAVPWTEEDFLAALRKQNCIGMVAERDEIILGYMIYESHKDALRVVNFAVAPEFQRQGIGSAMIAKLRAKMASGRRNLLTLEVRESNLSAQQFFRAVGLRATHTIRGWFEGPDGAEDAYAFRWEVEPGTGVGVNRVGAML